MVKLPLLSVFPNDGAPVVPVGKNLTAAFGTGLPSSVTVPLTEPRFGSPQPSQFSTRAEVKMSTSNFRTLQKQFTMAPLENSNKLLVGLQGALSLH
jgi:hypothetical protein